MLDLDKMQVLLTVDDRCAGVVRARRSWRQDDAGRVDGNPRLRVFSERAIRAVLDPIALTFRCRRQCSGRHAC